MVSDYDVCWWLVPRMVCGGLVTRMVCCWFVIEGLLFVSDLGCVVVVSD